MIFRAQELGYIAYYHRLVEENGKVYCRALNAITEKDEDFCSKCPLSCKSGRKHLCFYFDLTHNDDFSPEKEKTFHDGIIIADISPVFPLFSALDERWGETNNNEFLRNWETPERIKMEQALNKAAQYYKNQPEKMRDCIERAYEVSVGVTNTSEIDKVIAEILKGIE